MQPSLDEMMLCVEREAAGIRDMTDSAIRAEAINRIRALDCDNHRHGEADCPEYHVYIDGEWAIEHKMFTRADMSFWGFSAADVIPPRGMVLEFWPSNGEPHFEAE